MCHGEKAREERAGHALSRVRSLSTSTLSHTYTHECGMRGDGPNRTRHRTTTMSAATYVGLFLGLPPRGSRTQTCSCPLFRVSTATCPLLCLYCYSLRCYLPLLLLRGNDPWGYSRLGTGLPIFKNSPFHFSTPARGFQSVPYCYSREGDPCHSSLWE